MSFSCSQSLDGSFPPTPAEDRGSQRLSWSNLLQRLTELNGLSHRDAADHFCRSETGELGLKIVNVLLKWEWLFFLTGLLFFFRLCGRFVPFRLRQQFLLLSSGGDLGCRGRGPHHREPPQRITPPVLLQTPHTCKSHANHQWRTAALSCQWTLWPEGGADWAVCGQGRPGITVRGG